MFDCRLRSRLTVALTAVALSVSLGACSAKPGVALVVDGATYTEDQVSRSANEVSLAMGQPIKAADITTVLALADSYIEVGKSHNVDVSDQDVRNLYAQRTQNNGGELSAATVKVLRAAQISQELAQSVPAEEIGAQIGQLQAGRDIELNPRYGLVDQMGMISAPAFSGVYSPSDQAQ